MLSRRLTVTYSLLVLSFVSCENQGKGVGTDSAVVICGYAREAITARGCKNEAGDTPVDQSETYYQTCLMNQRIVEKRCRSEQDALAKCMKAALEGIDRMELYNLPAQAIGGSTAVAPYVCKTADKTVLVAASGGATAYSSSSSVNNGDILSQYNCGSREGICPCETDALSACSKSLPANVP